MRPARSRGPLHAPDVERLYIDIRDLLLHIGVRKFRVVEVDAEALVHDALLSLLQTGTSIENPRAWLVAAMCNACRSYWRHRVQEAVEDHVGEAADAIPDRIDVESVEREVLVRQLLNLLRPADREILRLHYFEQLTAREIALRLATTPGYAERRIGKAMRRLRALYDMLARGRTLRRAPATDEQPTSPAERRSQMHTSMSPESE